MRQGKEEELPGNKKLEGDFHWTRVLSGGLIPSLLKTTWMKRQSLRLVHFPFLLRNSELNVTELVMVLRSYRPDFWKLPIHFLLLRRMPQEVIFTPKFFLEQKLLRAKSLSVPLFSM